MSQPYTEQLGFRIWRQSGGEPMLQPHVHFDVEINYLQDGAVTYLHCGSLVTLEPGVWGVFWAGHPHQCIDSAPQRSGIWATVPLQDFLQWDLPAEFIESLLAGNFLQLRSASPDRYLLDELQLELWAAEWAGAGEIQRQGIRDELRVALRRLATFSRPGATVARGDPAAGSKTVLRVLSFLSENYTEALTAASVARAVGAHPKYVLQAFKRSFGMSFHEYLVRLRLGHAVRLLLTTRDSVLNCAFAAGFQSAAAFYAAFRRHVPAASPSALRENS